MKFQNITSMIRNKNALLLIDDVCVSCMDASFSRWKDTPPAKVRNSKPNRKHKKERVRGRHNGRKTDGNWCDQKI